MGRKPTPVPRDAHPLVAAIFRRAKKKGWAMPMLAIKADVGERTLRQWKSGTAWPSLPQLIKVYEALGLELQAVRPTVPKLIPYAGSPAVMRF